MFVCVRVESALKQLSWGLGEKHCIIPRHYANFGKKLTTAAQVVLGSFSFRKEADHFRLGQSEAEFLLLRQSKDTLESVARKSVFPEKWAARKKKVVASSKFLGEARTMGTMSGATNALYAPLNLNEELMRTLFPTLHHWHPHPHPHPHPQPLLPIPIPSFLVFLLGRRLYKHFATFHLPHALCAASSRLVSFRFRYNFGFVFFSCLLWFDYETVLSPWPLGPSVAPHHPETLPQPLALNLMLFVRQRQIAPAGALLVVAACFALRFVLSFCGMLPPLPLLPPLPWPGLNDTLPK